MGMIRKKGVTFKTQDLPSWPLITCLVAMNLLLETRGLEREMFLEHVFPCIFSILMMLTVFFRTLPLTTAEGTLMTKTTPI
jgi:hypothetical protein